ncbi:MAG TPA: DUF2071 domain-containing protein [Bacillota bacterium]|nr:DUF2071 domain-containing protein [Bacillota bacterium]
MFQKQTWLGMQQWDDCLFLHWPMPYDVVRSLVPDPFTLETFNGTCWVSIVVFRASETRMRGMSKKMGLRPYVQLNVRTYIRFHEEPAVYFFSVVSNHVLAFLGAKYLLSLPFEYAQMVWQQTPDGFFVAMQRSKNAETSARFAVQANVQSETFRPKRHSLSYWLTERYAFYSIKRNTIFKASIFHAPWELQNGTANVAMSGLMDGLSKKEPLVHYSRTKKTWLYPFKRVGKIL